MTPPLRMKTRSYGKFATAEKVYYTGNGPSGNSGIVEKELGGLGQKVGDSASALEGADNQMLSTGECSNKMPTFGLCWDVALKF